MQSQHYKTDWLTSTPIFYNDKTNKISKSINDVVDYRDLEFHSEGLHNYLDFGYSVFGQTPIKNVKFLPPNTTATIVNGKLTFKIADDDFIADISKTTTVKTAISTLKESVYKWELSVKGDIIIPTSGGYDSRLLNHLITDKSRVHAYTYGISKQQSNSRDVVYAKKLAELLGVKWSQIQLGNFHQHIPLWKSWFGASTHYHGMYQVEFYKKIAKQNNAQNILSGIFGDVWAGSINYQKIQSPEDLQKLGYTHGLNADSTQLIHKNNFDIRDDYWDKNKNKINHPKYQIISTIRLKMILISYLLTVPNNLGFNAWSPFLDKKVCLSLLGLSEEKRKNRLWQTEYFKKQQLDIHTPSYKFDISNTLNHQAINNVPLAPLQVDVLRELFNPTYINWINYNLGQNIASDIRLFLLNTPKIGYFSRKAGVYDKQMKAYSAYLTIKPIEDIIIKRNNS